MSLQAGQEVQVNWREAQGIVLTNIQKLKLDPRFNGGHEASCHVTFADAAGVSVYIARGHGLGGDLQAFLPAAETRFGAYFSPLRAVHMAYARTSHFMRIFPRQFV